MSNFDDFLDGSKFPGRPDHPDFWKLSEIFLQLDGRTEDGESDDDIITRICTELDFDEDSLAYMLRQRVLFAIRTLFPGMPTDVEHEIVALSAGSGLESFMAGIMFEQRRKND